ncbi:MAG: hypothetical protein HY775_06950 [Acidobacteria bacterium]|nr:hypothetical protein [Acidobacteriota bacterium]
MAAALGFAAQPAAAQPGTWCFNESPPGDVGTGFSGPGGWYYVGVDTGIDGSGPGVCVVTPYPDSPGTVVAVQHYRSTKVTYGKIPVCVAGVCKDVPWVPVMVDTGYSVYVIGVGWIPLYVKAG